MASILKHIEIDAPADAVWDAVSDFGAVHRRFAPGVVTNVILIDGQPCRGEAYARLYGEPLRTSHDRHQWRHPQ